MEKKVKKILIGFFVAMFLLTILSRAAASVIVAKVKVDQIKKDNLTYTLNGEGIVKGNAKKYIELTNGYKVGDVKVKSGTVIKKGGLLFQYDRDSLNQKKKELEDEYKKLVLQYEKSALITDNAEGTDPIRTAELTVENAKDDMNTAKEDIKYAEKSVQDDKNKDYDTLQSDLQTLKDSKEEALTTADRNIDDAKEELAKVNKPITELSESIENYQLAVQSKKEDQILVAYQQLYNCYYHGNYDEHQQKVTDAKKNLERAKEDLADTKNKWDNLINPWDQYSSDESVVKAYLEQISQRKEEIKNATRIVNDAADSYNQLTKKDTELDTYIQNYRLEIEKNNVQDHTYQILYQTICKNLDLEDDKIKLSEEKVNRAVEDKERINNSWDTKIKEAQNKADKLENDIKSIEEGTYDFTEDIKEERAAYLNAKKELKSARLQLQEAKELKNIQKQNKKVQDESINLEKESIQIDLNNKLEEIKKIDDLIVNNGEVRSTVSGVVLKSNLRKGLTLTGSEELIISVKGFELTMVKSKDDMKDFEVGDEITITTTSDEETITSKIEQMKKPDNKGNVTFTAILPKGHYTIGSSMEYSISKESKEYSMCIPVNAVREGANGAFVLVIRDKSSVLGKEQIATTVSIHVISQDSILAAVDGTLVEDDQIIISSNKNIEEGDRVRIDESEE